MHTEKLADGSLVEILDVTVCSACGEPFGRGLMTKSWTNCSCADGPGHRLVFCLRPGCGATTYDPPHVIQTGPTGSYR